MSAAPPPRSTLAPKLALVVLVLLMLALAHQYGLFQQFADPAGVKQALVQLGPWGYLGFVTAYTALQPIGVPGTVFIMAAPLIWPWPIAFALSMTGTMSQSGRPAAAVRDWLAMAPGSTDFESMEAPCGAENRAHVRMGRTPRSALNLRCSCRCDRGCRRGGTGARRSCRNSTPLRPVEDQDGAPGAPGPG